MRRIKDEGCLSAKALLLGTVEREPNIAGIDLFDSWDAFSMFQKPVSGS
jgi:hypothetical protein